MQISYKGPWDAEDVDKYLQNSLYPMRLACVGADGFPRVVAVWFRFVSGAFYCVSHRNSALVKLLRTNSRVGFEVSPNEPPYCGVRGQATTTLDDLATDPTLDKLLDRYLGGANSQLGNWLLSRRDQEILIKVQPHRIFSWDYRERMQDIDKAKEG